MEWRCNYIAITNQVEHARILDYVGIQQIMVDCENLGKAERQASRNAVINFHQIEDVSKLKASGIKKKIICRINGFHDNVMREIELAIQSGTDILMLPMILSVDNFRRMVEQVNGRVAILPLIETPYSIFKLKEIIEISKPEQIHFGLNDLCLSIGMKNLFEILLSPLFSSALSFVKNKVSLIGVGGIGDPLLPQKVSPDLIMRMYWHLGSRSVILSRSFFTSGYNSTRILNSINYLESIVNQKIDGSNDNELKYQIEKF